MNLEELNQILNEKDKDKLDDLFSDMDKQITIGKEKFTVDDVLKQYDPYTHDVMDTTKRPDDMIDLDGEEYTDSITGEKKFKTDTDVVPVNRLPVPIQKKIVLIAAAFLVGEKIDIESIAEGEVEEALLKLINKVWRDTKLDYKSKTIAKTMMSETHCAELWYDYPHESYWNGTVLEGIKRKPGMYILSEGNGDKLKAIFDEYNDLVAFIRGYEVDGEERADVYTEDRIISYIKPKNGEWEVKEGGDKPNPYKAIPIIYHSQERPEWSDVQPLISRKETKLSNFGDSNDAFGNPALVAEGDVENLPDRGSAVKQYQVQEKGSVKYLAHDGASENSNKEFEILDNEIHAGTHTPDISFNTMKGILGTGTSGIALKLLFMDPQMKASDKQEAFGEMIQRRLNLIMKMLISFNETALGDGAGLSVSPKFRPYMPINDVEFNELLIKAYEAGMISEKTMIEMSSLVADAEKEIEQIKKEKEEKPKEKEGKIPEPVL